MALTAAEISKQKQVFAAIRAAFNTSVRDALNLTSAQLKALNDAKPTPESLQVTAGFKSIIDHINLGLLDYKPAIDAADAATALYVASDAPVFTWTRFQPDMSSAAAIKAAFSHADNFYGPGPNGLPSIDNPTVFVQGMVAYPIEVPLNASTDLNNGGTGSSMYHTFRQPAPDELYCEYEFMIGADVLAGMTEEGVKLPGLAGAWERPGDWAEAIPAPWSFRLWARKPDAQGRMELAAYNYSQQWREDPNGNAFGEIIPTGKLLLPMVKYKLGQHVKLNTPNADGTFNRDGVFEILLDGVVVFSRTGYYIRKDARAKIQEFFHNIYHGGRQWPTSRITFYAGGVVVDNKPLTGSPVIDMGSAPAWRRGLPIGQWVDVPGTAPAATLPGMGTFFDGSFSGQANDRVNSVVYLPASAGHAVSDDNHVFAVDLKADAPRWRMLSDSSGARAPTDNAAHFPNGMPTGAHLYYSAQVVQFAGKPFVIRTANLAGSFVGNAPLSTDYWDPATGQWRAMASPPASQWKEWACALDARTGRIYAQDQGGMTAAFDSATGWSQGFPSNGWGYGWGGQVVDPVLDELLYDFGGYRQPGAGDYLEGLHLTRNVRITHPYTWVGAPARSPAQFRAMVIQERNRAIYVVGSDLGQPAFNRLDLNTWQMTNVGTVPQPVTVYNRIEDFPALGGIAHFPAFGSPMRFYATDV